MIAILILLIFSVAAACFDLRNRIIPNLLVLGELILGIGLSVYKRGVILTLDSLICCVLVVIILYPFFYHGTLGAGDVKLYAVLPIFAKTRTLLIVYFLIFCVAAVLGLGNLLLLPSNRKKLLDYLQSVYRSCTCHFIRPLYIPRVELGRIPMAVPMAIGVIASGTADFMGYLDLYI